MNFITKERLMPCFFNECLPALRRCLKPVGAGTLAVAVILIASTSCSGKQQSADKPPNERTKNVPEKKEYKYTNRLIHATSPYLLQHAHNPVDWHEWGKEAFDQAVKEDKPIFLSIGYAACHWCHVMEHECFENEEIAALLNEHFVSIKVDREERPDVDVIYMRITQAMNQGRGGWPMSLFLAPDRKPFFAATYIPPQPFKQYLQRVSNAWANQRDSILKDTQNAQQHLDLWAKGPKPDPNLPTKDLIDQVAETMAGHFDTKLGGFKTSGNKFPPSMAMDLMLRVYRRTGDQALLDVVKATLDNMARGGIYDHLGGGICRYSTDPKWLVPHFEKMLYDQALVSSIYLDAYQVTKDPLYAYTAGDIFDYVIGDLQSPQGGFYSTRDADSAGFEGAYYVWTVPQVEAVLGEKDAKLFCEYYDVTEKGNWFESRGHAQEGPKNILNIKKPPKAFAKKHDLDLEAFKKQLVAWREKMIKVRASRIPPNLDDKILTGWNGLMIGSLAKGARVLDQPKYAQAAARAADFVLKNLRKENLRKDDRLLRTYRDGKSHLIGYLSDYAFLIDGLLNLYEATFDRHWLDEAIALNETLIKYYYDDENGAFFYTASDAEKLIVRTKNPRDGAIPSGNSVEAMNLMRLAILLDSKELKEKAQSIFKAFNPMIAESPSSFERLLCAADFYYDQVREIAIIGKNDSPETAKLVDAVYDRYLPNKVVVQSNSVGEQEDRWPLLKGKKILNGKATCYVCINYMCKLPVTDAEELAKQLDVK